jgi:hypothetical protein
MSDLMSSLGSFLTSNTGALKGLASIAGTGSNIYSGINNAVNTSNYNSTQSYIQNLVKNPTALAAASAKLQQPLSAGLTDEVTNQAQAQMAERGLGGSPAAMTSAVTQSLAPYIQQNQSTAMQTLMQSLGLGSSAKPSALPQVDMSKLLAMFKANGSTSDPSAAMAQTGFADMSAPPTPLSLDTNVAPEDYASSYGT